MNDKYKEYRRKYYQLNKEKKNKQSKEWAEKNPEKRKEICERYRKNNPEKLQESRLKYNKKIKNTLKFKCRDKFNNKIEKGKIIRPTICSICNQKKPIIHGHHNDYTKPFDVIWCCRDCHDDIHRKEKNV